MAENLNEWEVCDKLTHRYAPGTKIKGKCLCGKAEKAEKSAVKAQRFEQSTVPLRHNRPVTMVDDQGRQVDPKTGKRIPGKTIPEKMAQNSEAAKATDPDGKGAKRLPEVSKGRNVTKEGSVSKTG